MINLHDLMDERSELPPPTLDRSRVASVRARVAARRRARFASVGAGCALVIAVIAGYAIAPHRAAPPQPATPTPSPSSIEPPTFSQGAELRTWVEGPLSQRELTVTWRPGTAQSAFVIHCDYAGQLTLKVTVTVNGEHHRNTACNGTAAGDGGDEFQPRLLHATGDGTAGPVGLPVGVPATATVRINGAVRRTTGGLDQPAEMPTEGTFGLGVREMVPFEDYPVQSRPATVGDLIAHGPDATPPALRMNPAHANASPSVQIEWDRAAVLVMTTPGVIRIRVNGVLFQTCTNYEYVALRCGASEPLSNAKTPRKGSTATVTIEVVHPPEDWGLWDQRVVLMETE